MQAIDSNEILKIMENLSENDEDLLNWIYSHKGRLAFIIVSYHIPKMLNSNANNLL